MSKPPPKLDELMDFPSVFVFRALGTAENELAARCTTAVTRALERVPDSIETRDSKGGRYLAVRIGAEVRSPDEVYAVYAALRAVEGVHLVL